MRVQTTEFGEVHVKFHHIRNDAFNYKSKTTGKKKSEAETYSECHVILYPEQDNQIEFVGRSYLHPNDQFNKEVGRRLSLERALNVPFEDSRTGLTNKTQREIWVGYFTR